MGIDEIRNTSAYLNIQYNSRIPDAQKEEDAGLPEPEAESLSEPADMDQIDFKEGDQAISEILQHRGMGVYQTVRTDPALAWSMKRQTYPSAARVDKRV